MLALRYLLYVIGICLAVALAVALAILVFLLALGTAVFQRLRGANL